MDAPPPPDNGARLGAVAEVPHASNNVFALRIHAFSGQRFEPTAFPSLSVTTSLSEATP